MSEGGCYHGPLFHYYLNCQHCVLHDLNISTQLEKVHNTLEDDGISTNFMHECDVHGERYDPCISQARMSPHACNQAVLRKETCSWADSNTRTFGIYSILLGLL